MLPFGNIATRPFLPGAPGDAFVTAQLLPVIEIQGPGMLVRGQLAIEAAPQVQIQSVPEAWHGIVAGQFATQGLYDPNAGGPGVGG